MNIARIRIDHLLTKKGLAASRSRARDMISRGCVTVGGKPVQKPGALIAENAELQVIDPARKYVSRAALKLIAGLDAANIEVDGQHAIDLGSSTGGFSQVLLERGAQSVLAIDVGHGQMAPLIASDPRVTSLEKLNARTLTADHFINPPSIVTSDMSFVSLTIAAEPALRLSAKKAHAVLLVKPQFEVGKDGIGKGGLVKSPAIADEAVERVGNWFNALPGWSVTQLIPSPLHGGDGNLEYLLCGTRSA